jgi:hypothetical protein
MLIFCHACGDTVLGEMEEVDGALVLDCATILGHPACDDCRDAHDAVKEMYSKCTLSRWDYHIYCTQLESHLMKHRLEYLGRAKSGCGELFSKLGLIK